MRIGPCNLVETETQIYRKKLKCLLNLTLHGYAKTRSDTEILTLSRFSWCTLVYLTSDELQNSLKLEANVNF